MSNNSPGWKKWCASPFAWVLALIFLFFSFSFLGIALWWPIRIAMLALILALLVRGVRFARRNPKHFVFALIIGAFLWMLFELTCLTFDRLYLARHEVYGRGMVVALTDEELKKIENLVANDNSYYAFDPETGWTIKPHGTKELYSANSRGFRGTREYEEKVPEGITRAICVGDSYTFSADVGDDESWEAYAEAGGPFEFMNLGVSGQGLTQAFLRYQRFAPEFETDVVFIGFMSNNIQRTINVFRPFLFRNTGAVSAKPYAALENGELVIKPNPLSSLSDYEEMLEEPHRVLASLGDLDYYVQKQRKARSPLPSGRLWDFLEGEVGARDYVRTVFNIDSAEPQAHVDDDYAEGAYPLQVLTQLFDRFVAEVKRHESDPVILIFPNRIDIDRYNNGQEMVYETLLNYLQQKGHEHIDVLELFSDHYGASIPEEVFHEDGHYSPTSNRMLAEFLTKYLQERNDEE